MIGQQTVDENSSLTCYHPGENKPEAVFLDQEDVEQENEQLVSEDCNYYFPGLEHLRWDCGVELEDHRDYVDQGNHSG